MRISPLVDLSNIDRVPVSVVLASNDGTCDNDGGEFTYSQIASKEKYLRYERGGHTLFWSRSDEAFMDRMVDTIETGTSSEGKYSVTQLAKESIN